LNNQISEAELQTDATVVSGWNI